MAENLHQQRCCGFAETGTGGTGLLQFGVELVDGSHQGVLCLGFQIGKLSQLSPLAAEITGKICQVFGIFVNGSHQTGSIIGFQLRQITDLLLELLPHRQILSFRIFRGVCTVADHGSFGHDGGNDHGTGFVGAVQAHVELAEGPGQHILRNDGDRLRPVGGAADISGTEDQGPGKACPAFVEEDLNFLSHHTGGEDLALGHAALHAGKFKC